MKPVTCKLCLDNQMKPLDVLCSTFDEG